MKPIQNIQEYLQEQNSKELLKFITCGSVDDGKSTLIGRLLYDTKAVFDDQIESIKSKSAVNGLDLALLVDGLQSEIEQGITIDVAYRYFHTPKRKFIIADTPGHEQYTRNMATAASNADAAVILIDARQGLLTQTKRHTFIINLMGIKNVIVAINKIDLVEYSKERYERIVEDYESFLRSNFDEAINVTYIPISALNGDNIVSKSANTSWYEGKALIEILESIQVQESTDGEFIYPVQYVNRPDHTFRGYSGNVVSGEIHVGEQITVLPTKKSSRVKEIVLHKEKKLSAQTGEAVTITLEDEIDISRGDIIIKEDARISYSNSFNAQIVWLDESPIDRQQNYIVKLNNTEVKGRVVSIEHVVDVNTLENEKKEILGLNDIASVSIELSKNLLLGLYKDVKILGSLIVIDPVTNKTVAAAMIQEIFTPKGEKKTQEGFEFEFNQLINRYFPHWEALDLAKG